MKPALGLLVVIGALLSAGDPLRAFTLSQCDPARYGALPEKMQKLCDVLYRAQDFTEALRRMLEERGSVDLALLKPIKRQDSLDHIFMRFGRRR